MESFWPFPTSKDEKALLRQLSRAVRQDDPVAVAQAIVSGAPPNALQLGGARSFLAAALKAGRYRAAEALIDAGASPLFPEDWRAANPSDPLAMPGTITEQAHNAVSMVISEANWPWVERFFSDNSLPWESLGDALYNSFLTAVLRGVPETTLDIMSERARVSQLGVPSDESLVEMAVSSGSSESVDRLTRRWFKGVSQSESLDVLNSLEGIIENRLSNLDVEPAPGKGLRMPRGEVMVAAIKVWLDHGGDHAKLENWVVLAAGSGMDKALSWMLTQVSPRTVVPQSWVAGGIRALSHSREVWKVFDKAFGEPAVNQALLSLASDDSFDDLFFERTAKSPVRLDDSVSHTVKRLGKSGVEISPHLVSLILSWRNPFSSFPSMIFIGSLDTSFLESLQEVGWDPTTKAPSGQEWEALMDHPMASHSRAWLRTKKLEGSLQSVQQKRRGPRL